MAATKKTLDVFRTEEAPHDWRWTLVRAGKIVDSSTEGFKRQDGVRGNILSALGLNLESAEWDRDDRVVKQGTVKRAVLNDARVFHIETVHVTIWKRK